jgi:acyl carrier protein
MLTVTDAVTKIKNVLHEQFDIDTTPLSDSTKLTDMGIDSLHLVDVMLDVETELDISIEDLSFSPETTLGELGLMVSKCFNERHID